MASLNKVMLIGNLTRDPEVRYTPKGVAVADIGLALNRYYTTDSQERREETTFVEVTLWNRQAELAGQYLAKGRSVYVEGRLQMDEWQDKTTGDKRTKLKIVGETIQFLGGQGPGSGGGGGSGRSYDQGGGGSDRVQEYSTGSSQPQSAPAASTPSAVPLSQDEDDDIPF